MKLEIGKRYRIENNGGILRSGDFIVSHDEGDSRFRVIGSIGAYTATYYTFVRLPSFGDEVEVKRGSDITWKHWYYLGENKTTFFLSATDGETFKSGSIVACEGKQYCTIKLIPPADDFTAVLGKTYNKADVEARMAELTPLGE